jgi:AcrR family transcriptional regulator
MPGRRKGNRSFTIGNQMVTEPVTPTRERILDAAVELFGRQGYSGTSVGEIEAAAGLAPRAGGLYKHFASKRALLEEAVTRRARVAQAAGEVVDATFSGDVAVELPTVGHASLRIVRDDQALMRIVMREGDTFPELRDEFYGRIVSRGQASTVAWLRLAAKRAGAAEPPDIEALASLVLGSIINHCVLQTLFGQAAAGVSDERFLAAWTDSTTKLLEAHGLVDEAPTQEAPA